MDEWRDGGMELRMDGRTERMRERPMEGGRKVWVDGWMNGWMHE